MTTTTTTRIRQSRVTAYYLGRPAAFWLTALASQGGRTKSARGISR